MEKIASFTVDHDTLKKGVYVSRIDGDAITYDIRMKTPNGGEYLSTAAAHTVEHLFATFVRNGRFKDYVIYVGPMGCRTGFYLILRDKVSYADALTLIKDAFAFMSEFDGEIPGCTKKECGNYLEHDLNSARKEARAFLQIAEGWSADKMCY
ncbi:MAG: S-ribosylhomocysteine lyase [Clostridia bacterium]|nr:S-ribosylhomocysteine lyase [Clostridia bacterium]